MNEPVLRGVLFGSPRWRRQALRAHGFTPRVVPRLKENRRRWDGGVGSRIIVWTERTRRGEWYNYHEFHGTNEAWLVLNKRLATEDAG